MNKGERCPYCNRLLNHYDERGKAKHLAYCKAHPNRYICTGRPAGRPRTRRRIESPKKRRRCSVKPFPLLTVTKDFLIPASTDPSIARKGQEVPDTTDYNNTPEVHREMMGLLEDIDRDVDCILDKGGKNMTEGFDSGMLAGLLSNKGVDPGIIAMLNDKTRDGNWGANGGVWIILLFLFLLGVGGNGFFGNRNGEGVAGVDRTVVNEANYSRLLDAVSTQGTRQEMAVQSLASALNCDVATINSALAGVDKQLAVNQGSIINAIQSCCCNMTSATNTTAAATQRAVENQACQTRQLIQQGMFQAQSDSATTRQMMTQAFCDQNAYLAEQFCAIRTREDQREIQNLREKLQEQREEANTRAILTAINARDRVSGTMDADAGTFTGNIGRPVYRGGSRPLQTS